MRLNTVSSDDVTSAPNFERQMPNARTLNVALIISLQNPQEQNG